jgi:hypothetical protein
MKRIAAALTVLLLAGCGSAAEPESAGTPSGAFSESMPIPTETALAWTECVNSSEGYAISYPSSWHTATLTPEDECAFFHPEPFEIVEGSEYPVTALEAHWLEKERSFAQALDELTDPMFARTISREGYSEAHFAGVVLETEATGAGLLDAGTRAYGYVLNVNGRAFLVQTTELPGSDNPEYDKSKLVVNGAVGTLRFFAPTGGPSTRELPLPVLRTLRALESAAASDDYDALADLIPKSGFTYTYGGPFPGGATAYWRELAGEHDPSPLAVLEAILAVPHTKVGNHYVWPFAYDRDPASLTDEELDTLARIASPQEIAQWQEFGHYLGWRAGIRQDGTWIFFVAGD